MPFFNCYVISCYVSSSISCSNPALRRQQPLTDDLMKNVIRRFSWNLRFTRHDDYMTNITCLSLFHHLVILITSAHAFKLLQNILSTLPASINIFSPFTTKLFFIFLLCNILWKGTSTRDLSKNKTWTHRWQKYECLENIICSTEVIKEKSWTDSIDEVHHINTEHFLSNKILWRHVPCFMSPYLDLKTKFIWRETRVFLGMIDSPPC